MRPGRISPAPTTSSGRGDKGRGPGGNDRCTVRIDQKIHDFGAKWEVQAAIRGSCDLSCKALASKALTSLTQALDALGHLHASTKRELNGLGHTWDLLSVLLDRELSHTSSSPHTDLHVSTLESIEVLSRLVPSVVPTECLPLLIFHLGCADSSQGLHLDPSSFALSELNQRTANVCSGLAAQILTQMIGQWRLSLLMNHIGKLQASQRLLSTCLWLLPSINSPFWLHQIKSSASSYSSSPPPNPPAMVSPAASTLVGRILQLVSRLVELGSTDDDRSIEGILLSTREEGWIEVCLRCAQGMATEGSDSSIGTNLKSSQSSEQRLLSRKTTNDAQSSVMVGLHTGLTLLHRITSLNPHIIRSLGPSSRSSNAEYGPIAVWILSRLLAADAESRSDQGGSNRVRERHAVAWIASATLLSDPIFWPDHVSESVSHSTIPALWKLCRLGIVFRLKSWLLNTPIGQSSEFMRPVVLLSCAVLGGSSTMSSASRVDTGDEFNALRGHICNDPVAPMGQLLLLLEQNPPGSWPLPGYVGSSQSSIQSLRDEERAMSFHLMRELASWGMRAHNRGRFASFVASLSSLAASRGGQRKRDESKVDLARAASLSCVLGGSRDQMAKGNGLELDFALSLCFQALTPSAGSVSTRVTSWNKTFGNEAKLNDTGIDLLVKSVASICGQEAATATGRGGQSKSRLSVEIVKALGKRGSIEAFRLISQHHLLGCMIGSPSDNEDEGSILSLAQGLKALLLTLVESIRMDVWKGDGSLLVLQPTVHTALMAMLQLTVQKEGLIKKLLHDPLSTSSVFKDLNTSLESFLRCSVSTSMQRIEGWAMSETIVWNSLGEMGVLASLLILRLFDQAGVPSNLFLVPSNPDRSSTGSLSSFNVWADREFTDISLVLPRSPDVTMISAHAVILEAASATLAKKMDDQRLEVPSRPLELNLSSSIEPHCFQILLDFMTNGSCLVPPSVDPEKLAKLARALDMNPLSSLLRLELPSNGQRVSSSLVGGPHLSPPTAIQITQDESTGKKHIHLEDLLERVSRWRLSQPHLDSISSDAQSACDVFVVAPSFSGRHGIFSFPSHRVILAARHSYFGSLFCRWMDRDGEEEAKRATAIPEADSQVTDLILQYLYTGSISPPGPSPQQPMDSPRASPSPQASPSHHDQLSIDYAAECPCARARACVRSAMASDALLLPPTFASACTAHALEAMRQLADPSCLITLLRDAALMENRKVIDAAVIRLSRFDQLALDKTEEWAELHEPLKDAVRSSAEKHARDTSATPISTSAVADNNHGQQMLLSLQFTGADIASRTDLDAGASEAPPDNHAHDNLYDELHSCLVQLYN